MFSLVTLLPFLGLALSAPAPAADASSGITITAYSGTSCSGSVVVSHHAITTSCSNVGTFQSFKIMGTSSSNSLYIFEGADCTSEETEASSTKPLNSATAGKCWEVTDWYPTPLYGAKDTHAHSVQLK